MMNLLKMPGLLYRGAQASAYSLSRKFTRHPVLPGEGQYPIVLMHGFAGFRDIRIGKLELFDYFNGVQPLLEQMGYSVHAPTVQPFGTPSMRAASWFQAIEQIRRDTGAEKVHLIAHSQGCVDARLLVAPVNNPVDTPLGPLSGLGYGKHVASLLTLGGPHLGTALVDQFDTGDKSKREITDALLELASVIAQIFNGKPEDALGAIQSLGREYMLNHFNPVIQDDLSVPCFAIAGNPETEALVGPMFKKTWAALCETPVEQGGGPNDGFITVHSALFGQTRPHWQDLGFVLADHVAEIGIPMSFPPNRDYDHLACFAGMAQLVDPFYQAAMTLQPSGLWARAPKAPGAALAVTKAKAASKTAALEE